MEPASGTPNHPIEISDGSSFHGSPYRGPDSYQERFKQWDWYFTPSEHPSSYQQQQQQQQQDPSEDSRFRAVTPPPPPPVEQQPPPEPPSYMAGSDEVNSHPEENRDNAKIQLTGAELKAIVDDAVTKALEWQYSEYSGTHSRTLSTPHAKPKTHSEAHSKPPPTPPKPKKEDDRLSSNENSVNPKKIVVDDAPRAKGCTETEIIKKCGL
ncbi:uncharacterized protein P8B7.26-like [Helianthus annuus]|uniref:uncharacterized protein P8B7.26-like n=1 Tax=Helianthus annuus TaxID=4232 RepID=UPI0016532D22|nr:uncharacterized protein P8B7.26-like [Helianthus annuus]